MATYRARAGGGVRSSSCAARAERLRRLERDGGLERRRGGDASAGAPPSAAVDYAALLTQDDVRAITGHADATPMPESDWNQREGTSKYFAIYQGNKWDEALWLRVGHAGMFEEQRSASDTTPETIEGLGDDAFWWEYTSTDRGIAVLVGETTYIVSTNFRYEKPQVTDAQLMEVAQTIVGRL